MDRCPRSTKLDPHRKGSRARSCPECRFYVLRQRVQERAVELAEKGEQTRLF